MASFKALISFTRKYPVPLALIVLTFLFFWPVFLENKVPFPSDLLTGAYFPWLDSKWGYPVGVPVKNPLISDVFSQLFPWRQLAVSSYKNFSWPLWNFFSYSGHPLLANFQSAVFNPLNILLIIFGSINGWTYLVISQSILSMVFMYLFLRQLQHGKTSSLTAATIYAFSAFSIVWLEYATFGFVLAWLPLGLFFIDKFFQKQNLNYLFPLSVIIFLITVSGHLQSSLYAFLIIIIYFLWKAISTSNLKLSIITNFILIGLLGTGLIAVQVLPTLELTNLSVRFSENYIQEINYGLIPPKHLITLLAPDFFGNPTTANYFGFFNYNETAIYQSVLGLLSLLFSLLSIKKLKSHLIFLLLAALSLILAVDNPISLLIYKLNIVGLSTSSAGRAVFILSLAVPPLTAYFLDNLKNLNLKKFIFLFSPFIFLIPLIGTLLFFGKNNLPFSSHIINFFYNPASDTLAQNIQTSFRNLFYPSAFLSTLFLVLLFFRKTKYILVVIFLITIFDLYRLSNKYLPFTPKHLFFPSTDITTFLQKDSDVFRIDKETGPLLPPNTWTSYSLMSPSGYDPLAVKDYVDFYNQYINNQNSSTKATRYSELKNYDPIKLGQLSVKYLLSLKYTDIAQIRPEGEFINHLIGEADWQKVYENGSVVIFKNPYFKPLVRPLVQHPVTISNTVLGHNSLSFDYKSDQESRLLVANTWMPGWYYNFNGSVSPVDSATPFQSIKLPPGEGKVNLFYKPNSFIYGRNIFLLSLFLYTSVIILYNYSIRHDKDNKHHKK
ncbi:MAG: hypothetical protein ACOX6N_04020 [Patescibacteria group bacterium]|jgi:hypothetical protein